nr:orf182 [Zancudomyces culisetae]AAW49487.1 orf182 [Zancudomyces culisetae]
HLIYKTGNKLLSKAVDKYNINNLTYLILEFYDNPIDIDNYTDLLNLETKYISLYKPEYNFLSIVGSFYGYKHTIETIKKMRENYSQERKDRIGLLNKNKILSDEIKALMSFKALNRTETLKNKYKIKSSKVLELLDINNNILKEYSNIKNFCKDYKCCTKTVKKFIIEKKIFRNKFYIKYKK